MRIVPSGGPATPNGWPLTWWNNMDFGTTASTPFVGVANTLNVSGFVLPAAVQFNKIFLNILVADAANLYDVGIYTYAGALVAHIGAQHLPSTGILGFSVIGGPITLNPGRYFFALTGNATTAANRTYTGANFGFIWTAAQSVTASSGGALPSSMTPPADGPGLPAQSMFGLSI